ncbi:MAG: VOC family protein [Shimia sp.]|uniref:VOC family protein n=1 Tax=Shimia sp. TaxID=1954381 RepID=UPI0040590428
MPKLSSIDHLVLSVANITQTVAFYTEVLGMQAEQFTPADGSIRWALKFGNQKINLHLVDTPFAPHAQAVAAGSGDLCFLTNANLEIWQAHLEAQGVEIEQQPIARTGATGPIFSLYVRDPDGNLIEISTPRP